MKAKIQQPAYDSTNYGEEIPYIKEALDYLKASYLELTKYRERYTELDDSYRNVFTGDRKPRDNQANILRSGFGNIAVEQAMRGMLFPVFKTQAVNISGRDSKNAEALSKAVMEWYIKESGFEGAYIDSKEDWAKVGDSFRRPFLIKMKKKGQFWPQYEDIDPTCILLDGSGTVLWSETVSRSMSFIGYTRIYTEHQLKREFGKEIVELAVPGAMIDDVRYAEKMAGQDNNNMRYYEVLIYQSCADETEMVLVGQTALPVNVNIAGKKNPEIPTELKGVTKVSNVYLHRDKFDRPVLRYYQNFFYYDNRGPRNLGLIDKLAPIQIAHEDMENTKLESTKLRMFEIPTVAGGRDTAIRKSIKQFIEERKLNMFAVLHAPQSGVDGILPKFDMLRFNGVPASDATSATQELYSLARNTVGISLSRLEIQEHATLGQSQIIEQEKVDSIEGIILRNKPILEHEFEGILDYIIEMDGFGLNDITFTVDYWKEEEGIAEQAPKEVLTTMEIDVQAAARKLKGDRFKVVIDDSSLINRTYATMMEEWVRLMGMINPAEQPELFKWVLARVAQAGRFQLPPDLLSPPPPEPSPDQAAMMPTGGEGGGATAMGGMSQFPSSEPGVQAPGQAAPMPEPGTNSEMAMNALTMAGGSIG